MNGYARWLTRHGGYSQLARYPLRATRRALARWPAPRRFEHFNKVFCVGWLKTGTSSFAVAMRELGFKHCSFDRDLYRRWRHHGEIDALLRCARHFESFDDLPWNQIELLQRLDQTFPNSRFVLTLRDSESWYRSYAGHREDKGMSVPAAADSAKVIADYEARNQQVRAYFSGERAHQLLEMNIFEGDGYAKLCEFLQLRARAGQFPHANRRISKRG